mmetsp:Transcript_687/g.903  ORF Transcript_687/g.903 Transcript_687/m.903 type:complete len:82 (+) Transcript_687:105-350(+)
MVQWVDGRDDPLSVIYICNTCSPVSPGSARLQQMSVAARVITTYVLYVAVQCQTQADYIIESEGQAVLKRIHGVFGGSVGE